MGERRRACGDVVTLGLSFRAVRLHATEQLPRRLTTARYPLGLIWFDTNAHAHVVDILHVDARGVWYACVWWCVYVWCVCVRATCASSGGGAVVGVQAGVLPVSLRPQRAVGVDHQQPVLRQDAAGRGARAVYGCRRAGEASTGEAVGDAWCQGRHGQAAECRAARAYWWWWWWWWWCTSAHHTTHRTPHTPGPSSTTAI